MSGFPVRAKGPIPKVPPRKRSRAPLHAPGQRRPRVRVPRYLAVLARCSSPIDGSDVDIQVAHVRFPDAAWNKPDTGLQRKPDDKWSVPLTAGQHQYHKDAQHKGNEREYWERYGIAILAVCHVSFTTWEQATDRLEAEERVQEIWAMARVIKPPADVEKNYGDGNRTVE